MKNLKPKLYGTTIVDNQLKEIIHPNVDDLINERTYFALFNKFYWQVYYMLRNEMG